MAQIGPGRAFAQYTTFPPSQNGQTGAIIRSDNTLFVPDGGLRLVNGQNRTLGVFTVQAGNAGLALFDSRGRPSVMIMSGQAGSININASDGPTIRMSGQSGRDGVVMSTNDTVSSIKLREAVTLTSANDGGRLTVADTKGSPTVRIVSSAEGGRITGYDKGHSTIFEILTKGDSGELSLYKKDSQAGFTAQGSGSAKIVHDKETLWKIPGDDKN
jgi:hypothetical protein